MCAHERAAAGIIAKDLQRRAIELSGFLWLVEPYFTDLQANNLQGFRWHTPLQTYFSGMYFT